MFFDHIWSLSKLVFLSWHMFILLQLDNKEATKYRLQILYVKYLPIHSQLISIILLLYYYVISANIECGATTAANGKHQLALLEISTIQCNGRGKSCKQILRYLVIILKVWWYFIYSTADTVGTVRAWDIWPPVILGMKMCKLSINVSQLSEQQILNVSEWKLVILYWLGSSGSYIELHKGAFKLC